MSAARGKPSSRKSPGKGAAKAANTGARTAATAIAPDARLVPGFYLTLALTAAMPLAAAQLIVTDGAGLSSNVRLVWFGLLTLLALLLAVVDQLRQGGLSLPRSWLLPAVVLLGAVAIVTAIFADNLYLARLGALRTCLAAIYLLCLLMVADQPWKRRWLLAALVAGALAVALGVAVSGQAAQQTTLEYYQADRLQVLAQMGIEPGSLEEQMLLNRMHGDRPGTFYHPNLMSGYLMVAALVGLGLIIPALVHTWRQRSWDFVLALVLIAGLLTMAVAIALARSRAAMGALALGLLIFALIAIWPRRRCLHLAAVLLGLLAVVALPAVIMTASTGPEADSTALGRAVKSLAFRGYYWRGAAAIVADNPYTGTGSENFGRYYPQHKLPYATEEVADPHNAFLWAAATMGIGGLAAMAALALAGGLLIARALRQTATRSPASSSADIAVMPAPRQVVLALLLALPTIILFHALGRAAGLVDATLFAAGWLMLVRLTDRGFLAGLLHNKIEPSPLAANASQPNATGGQPNATGGQPNAAGGQAAGQPDADGGQAAAGNSLSTIIPAAALVAVIIGWWLQAMVGMNYRELPNLASLLLPAAALLMLCSPRRWQMKIPADRWLVVLGPLLAVVVAYLLGLMLPVVRASAAMDQARQLATIDQRLPPARRLALQRARWPELRLSLLRAADIDPLWPEPHAMLASGHWARASASPPASAERINHLRSARQALQRQLQLDPRSISAWRLMAQISFALADEFAMAAAKAQEPAPVDNQRVQALRAQGRAMVDQALGALKRAVELYPTKASIRAQYASRLVERGHARQARQQATRALQLDDLMPEQQLRLTDEERSKMAELADSK